MRISDWSSDVCSSDLQRRKRVFLVASGGDDLDPAEVLFERAGLLGDSSAGRAPWQEAAHDAGPGAEAAGACAGLAGFAGLKQPYGKVTPTFGFSGGIGPVDVAACRSEERRVGTEGVST